MYIVHTVTWNVSCGEHAKQGQRSLCTLCTLLPEMNPSQSSYAIPPEEQPVQVLRSLCTLCTLLPGMNPSPGSECCSS